MDGYKKAQVFQNISEHLCSSILIANYIMYLQYYSNNPSNNTWVICSLNRHYTLRWFALTFKFNFIIKNFLEFFKKCIIFIISCLFSQKCTHVNILPGTKSCHCCSSNASYGNRPHTADVNNLITTETHSGENSSFTIKVLLLYFLFFFYHFGPGWNFYSEHGHPSAAATVPALLVVYMNRHLLIGLQNRKHWLTFNHYLVGLNQKMGIKERKKFTQFQLCIYLAHE